VHNIPKIIKKLVSRSTFISTVTIIGFYIILSTPDIILAHEINRVEYADKLRALWLGECIANWTGLITENDNTTPPFYTDDDWRTVSNSGWETGDTIDYVLNLDPWLADDDTDIEYTYIHLLTDHNTTTLNSEQIRDGWIEHINRFIWVSNNNARTLMNKGISSPVTSFLKLNSQSLWIDAQLTTEIFGILAPGMPDKALQMAKLPIQTTASGYAAHAAQYFVVLYSLASVIPDNLQGSERIVWLANEARKYIPNSSKTADIYDFVYNDYMNNSDVNDWESTRDNIYEHYQLNAVSNGWDYLGWAESGVNFGSAILCMLYGQGDFRRTIQIGVLSGWDSDNPTATIGGLIAFIEGYDSLVAQFPEQGSFSDNYDISRTRDNMPDYLPDADGEDTFTMLSQRMLTIIDQVVTEKGGELGPDFWTVQELDNITLNHNPIYNEYLHSANNRIRENGGTITVSTSTPILENLSLIADGLEFNSEGKEYDGGSQIYSSNQGEGHEGEIQSFSIDYGEPVEISFIRFIEGTHVQEGGYFDSAAIEVNINNQWILPPEGIIQSDPFISHKKHQVINYYLNNPINASGIRISGRVGGSDGFVNIIEFDAFSQFEQDFADLIIDRYHHNENDTISLSVYINTSVNSIVNVEFYVDDLLITTDIDGSDDWMANWIAEGIGEHNIQSVINLSNGSKIISSKKVLVQSVLSPWNFFDVGGELSIPGSAEIKEDTLILNGSGNFLSKQDDFAFVYQILNGNGEIISKISELDSITYKTVAGIMIRDNLNSDAKYGSILFRSNKSVRFRYRKESSSREVSEDSINLPCWLKLNRIDDIINCYYSVDGSNWIKVGSETVLMNTDIYIGFAIASGIGSSITQGKFTNYNISNNPSSVNDPTMLKGNQLETYSLENYPNPFNSNTIISFNLPVESRVDIKIYNILGKLVIKLIDNEKYDSGLHSISFDRAGIASGMYFIQANYNSIRQTKTNYTFVRKALILK